MCIGVHTHESITRVQIDVDAAANDGRVEGFAETREFDQCARFEDGREDVGVGDDVRGPHMEEGSEGVAEEAAGGVAADDGGPGEGGGREVERVEESEGVAEEVEVGVDREEEGEV